MDTLLTAAATLAFLLLFLGLGVWVFISLALVATASLFFLHGMDLSRIGSIASGIIYRYSTSWELSAIPMFIWMGEIIFRTDISTRLFRGLSPFVDYIPGRLLHTNVLGCTLFAAVSGSSPATTATVGRITTRELGARGYDDRLSLGSLAGAGSLGLLIPPSIVMIVYGILAEQSISRLFAAGVLPGLMISGLYSSYIMIRAKLNPALVPAGRESRSAMDFLRALWDLAPLAVLMTIVLGSIYTGIATPSEAAAVGVIAAIVIALVTRQLTLTLLRDTLMGALRTSTMVCSILITAAFMSTAIGYLHIPADVADGIASLNLPPWGLLVVLSLFYLGLGFFLDGTSIVVMSLPISLPLALQAGFDPIWFGVYLVLMVEMAQVTPPVGFNLFVLQGISGRPISYVARAALPFFVLMLVGVALLAVFPGIALWLPNFLYG
ncbi:TRAP transporter large permease [Pseudooceanicola spongiae]|uniref:TRAP transporter large permease protein n=1 Tax=Pseudooceanicola spongiae TaxID=2613965 RepID=A0A7L9WRS6_9RHOB|nr:TRAP transporter large permease subunit [Pseudooceanicola spongiae]QOL83021.1 TRAP transporter large permease subunit [Pseudooceanicola spongiae]